MNKKYKKFKINNACDPYVTFDPYVTLIYADATEEIISCVGYQMIYADATEEIISCVGYQISLITNATNDYRDRFLIFKRPRNSRYIVELELAEPLQNPNEIKSILFKQNEMSFDETIFLGLDLKYENDSSTYKYLFSTITI